MKAVLIFITVCSLLVLSNAEIHAVLVAGSNGFWNYRHQSDVCHAYHTLLTKGVKAENIIVMAYDDIANDSSNPFPGKVFNKPTYANPGVDVYAGCKIDYKGADVNPANYLAIIQGQAAKVTGGNGRVLKSTSADHVFLNFADHGATGLIAFPDSYLYADDLLSALNNMHTTGMYGQLVYYLEACESGSMFQKLPNSTRIYATSAASPDESSWATYCDPDDQVGGTHIGSCLGDLYSVKWMEDTDAADTSVETLLKQFQTVKAQTTQSQVMQWGDLSFDSEEIGQFVGETKSTLTKSERLYNEFKRRAADPARVNHVDSRDAKLHYLMTQARKNNTLENRQAVEKEKADRQYFQKRFNSLADQFKLTNNMIGKNLPEINNWSCLKASVSKFEAECGRLSEYALKFVRHLVFVCETTNESFDSIKNKINVVCKEF